MSEIIGREEECRRLAQCMREKQAQLVLVYGRRRVGKTYLIEQFFHLQFSFRFTGMYQETKSTQLQYFTAELRAHTAVRQEPKTWMDAFRMLYQYLETLPQDEKKVVFFDELPWMDTHKSGFLTAFEWFWNQWGHAMDNLVFIACGSATSWMVKHLDQNKGGLFRRETAKLYLQPFTLYETEQYLQSRNIYWSRYDICMCYMVFGGIPDYLKRLDPGRGLNENVDRLFFGSKAELGNEFDVLYHTLFTNSSQYIAIVEALFEKRNGLTRAEILQRTGFPDNGVLTEMLNNLSASGFIQTSRFFQHRKKDCLYRLSDYFSAFYLQFKKNDSGRDPARWSKAYGSSRVHTWAGLTFEQICRDHLPEIRKKLGISGIPSEAFSWFYRPSDHSGGEALENGAQIDLVIDRSDQTIHLCEEKFVTSEYLIDRDNEMNLRNKIDTFRRATKTRKTLSLVMITSYGVKQGKYSNLVNGQVLLDDLFEKCEH